MKLKLSFKKLLSNIGLLTITVPTTLSVVSCDLRETKINLNDVIKNKVVDGNKINEQNQVIEEVIRNNPDLTKDIFKISNFKPTTTIANGSLKLIAIEDKGYTGEVEIIITMKNGTEIEKIINKIKSIKPKTKKSIEAWKEYFKYYEKNIASIINNLDFSIKPHEKNPSAKLKQVIQKKVEETFDEIITNKDGLLNYRYDKFWISSEIKDFSSNPNRITIKFTIKFIWNKQNDIESVHTEQIIKELMFTYKTML